MRIIKTIYGCAGRTLFSQLAILRRRDAGPVWELILIRHFKWTIWSFLCSFRGLPKRAAQNLHSKKFVGLVWFCSILSKDCPVFQRNSGADKYSSVFLCCALFCKVLQSDTS